MCQLFFSNLYVYVFFKQCELIECMHGSFKDAVNKAIFGSCGLNSFPKIPASHELLDQAKLQEEAGRSIGSLLSLTASPALSRYALLICACIYIL